MKPHVICHMAASLDGKIVPRRWRPEGYDPNPSYERLHDTFDADAWLIGRVTGENFAKGSPYPEVAAQTFPREAWFATRTSNVFAIVLDKDGRISWGRSDIGGDPLIVVLSEVVSDAHLAGLRADGVSYIFAGYAHLELASMLHSLNHELGITRLVVEGGGGVNGSFVRAGLVDQLSLLMCPVIDGCQGAPSVFDSGSKDVGQAEVVSSIVLERNELLDDGAVWLSYRVTNGPSSTVRT